MAVLSFTKYVKKVCGLLVIMPILALTGCGEGDGPVSIANTAIPPLDPLPVGFCDPITFEAVCPNRIASLEEFEGGPITILANPQVDANNDSATVARLQKFQAASGATFGGGRLNLSIPFEVAAGEVFTMNVWSPRPVPVQLQAGIATANANHGGSGWEVLAFDLGGAAGSVSSIAIIFDNGINGNAGIDPDNWTFYFDDITLVPADSAPAAPIDPEVSLYDPPEAPDLDADVTAFDSQSVINDMFADDSTYSPVLAVSSGVGYGANIAQIGFIGFAAGFASDYESLDFKVKGMPNNVIFVKLYDSVDSLRLNLTSSAYSGALTNGWYQVSIPISAFNGVSLATGIVFESDNTAPLQFTMLLNDVGFAEGDDGGSGGNGGNGGATLGVFSETNTDPFVSNTTIVSAGNPVTINGASTAVTPFDGSVSLALTYTTGGDFGGAIFQFDDADLSAYATLKFSIDTSEFANFADLTVQLEPPPGGSGPGNFVFLSDYTPVANSGNWNTYEIPLTAFDTVNLSLVNKVGFFNARDGSDVLLAGTLYLDDIHFASADAGGGGEANLGVFSETNTDPFVSNTTIVSAGNPVTINGASTAVTPFDGSVSLALTYTTGGDFGGAIFQFDDADLSAYTTLKFSIDTSEFTNFADLTVQLEPPGEGAAGTNVALSAYTPVATSGNWNTYEIPLTAFDAVNLSLVNKLGFFNARDGSDVLLAGTLYLDDIHFTSAGGGGNGGGVDPGDNLAVNGDFETGDFTGWTQFPSAGTTQTIIVDGATSSNVARLFIPTSAGGVNNVLKQERLLDGEGVFNPGDIIQIGFDVRGEPGEGILFVKSVCETAGGICGDKVHNGGGPFTPGGWAPYTDTFTLGADVSGYTLEFAAVCGSTGTCTAEYFIDNVSITIQ